MLVGAASLIALVGCGDGGDDTESGEKLLVDGSPTDGIDLLDAGGEERFDIRPQYATGQASVSTMTLAPSRSAKR